MLTTWLRTALVLAIALLAAGVAALLLHLPLPGTTEGPPSLSGLLAYLKPVVIFGWPAAVAAILMAPRLPLLSSLIYWLGAGLAIGAAGLLFLKHGELTAFRDASTLSELAKFGVTGALGGLVYWLLAGRSTAAGGAGEGSAFGLGNLALASLIGLAPPLLAGFAPGDVLKTAQIETQAPAPAAAPVHATSSPAASSAPEKKQADETAQHKADEEKRLAEEAAKRKADEEKRLAEEAAKRKADDEKHRAEEAAKRKADEEKHRAEEAAKRKADEEKRLAEEAAKRKADDEKRLAEEAAKRKADEEKRLAEEAAKRKADEEKRLAEEAAKRKADEEKRLAELAAKSKSDEPSHRADSAKAAAQAACAADLELLLSSKLIKFGLNSAVLDSEASGFIGRVAEKLKSCSDFKLTVGGYSDTSGSATRNLEISKARAEAVKGALVAGGVGAERVTARGYGSSLPEARGDEARAERPGRKAVIAAFDTTAPAAKPVTGASEAAASPTTAPCSADAGKLLLSETLYFGSGSLALKGDQRAALRQLAQFAKRCDNVRMTVTGHTDNVGSTAANDELSTERAARIAALLVRLGAPKNRIVTNGIGSARPAETNDTPAGRARNRRVVISFEPA